MNPHSETSSVASGKKSNSSSQGPHRRNSYGEKQVKKYARKYHDLDEEDQVMEAELQEEYDISNEYLREDQNSKKEVDATAAGHIELKDLKEKDFLDLIEAKNQDKRFYGWLHFGPIFEDEDQEMHYKVDPQQDIEYFR